MVIEEDRKNKTRDKTILIVDDNELILEFEKDVLQTLGFNVEIAVDGCEALQKIKQNTYRAIITDIEMPRMTGEELYFEVKKLGLDTHKKIVFTSSSIPQSIMKTGNKFLQKPFSANQLIETVRELSESNSN